MKKVLLGLTLFVSISVSADTCTEFSRSKSKKACTKAKFENPNATEKLLSACREFSTVGIIVECFQAIETNHNVTYEQLAYCRRLSDKVGTIEHCLDQLDNTNWFDF